MKELLLRLTNAGWLLLLAGKLTYGQVHLPTAPVGPAAVRAASSPHVEYPDSVHGSLREDMRVLKQENEAYRTALDINSNLFGGISTYFTVVTLLLTLLLAAVPLVSYFLVLRPNKRMLAKVERLEGNVLEQIEENFERYFRNLRKAKMQRMITLLDDDQRVSEAANYFLLNDADELEEADIAEVIRFLAAGREADSSDLRILNSLVIHSGRPGAEKYYKSVFERDDTRNYPYAIEYLVTSNFGEHIRYVEKIIAASADGHALLLDFFDYLAERYLGRRGIQKTSDQQAVGVHYVELLFNSEPILQAITGKQIPRRFKDARLGNDLRLGRNALALYPFLRDTKYYLVYLRTLDEKYQSRQPAQPPAGQVGPG